MPNINNASVNWAAHVDVGGIVSVVLNDDKLTVKNGDNIVCVLLTPEAIHITDMRTAEPPRFLGGIMKK